MAAADYTWITYDLRTGTRLAELPLSSVIFADKLNDTAAMSGDLQLNTGQLGGLDLTATTQPGRTGLYADRGGVPVWDGIIWDRTYDSESGRLTLSCATGWSYYNYRRVPTTRIYTATEQVAIVKQLLDDVATYAPPLTVPTQTATGVLRARSFYWYEKAKVAELIENMAAVRNGFDFSIDLSYSAGGALVRTFNTYYPRRGRPASQSGHVFEYGGDTLGNIVSYQWPDLGSQETNQLWNLGAGNGDTMMILGFTDSAKLSAGYPLLEDTISNKDTTDWTTLSDQARAELTARSNMQGLPDMTVLADSRPRFGSWTLGDDARIRISDYRFPRTAAGDPGLDVWRRIVGYEVTVPDDGSPELVKLTLAR